jgi:hypothetical protein
MTASGPARPSVPVRFAAGMRVGANGIQIPDFSFPASSAYAVPKRGVGRVPLIAPQLLNQPPKSEHAYLSAQSLQAPTIAGLPQTGKQTTTSASPRGDTGGGALPIGIVIVAAVGVGAIGATHVGLLQRKLARTTD